MKNRTKIAVLCIFVAVAIATLVTVLAVQPKPPAAANNNSSLSDSDSIPTPAACQQYWQSDEYKAEVQREVLELRKIFIDLIDQQYTKGHRDYAYLHIPEKYSKSAVEQVVAELESKGWKVTKTFTPGMLKATP